MMSRPGRGAEGGASSPWEQQQQQQQQHGDGLPRFSYKSRGDMVAPSSSRSFKGFLITCPLDREKSATKEAMNLLMRYLSVNSPNSCLGTTSANEPDHSRDERYDTMKASLKGYADDEVRSSPSSNAIGLQGLHEIDGKESIAVNLKRSDAEPEKSNLDNACAVFFLKMAQKGIISIFLENINSDDPVDILSKVLEDILKGATCPLRWCQRMIPIQATCLLSKESLGPLVFGLVKQYLKGFLPTEDQPLKFAIRYNRRGIASREENGCKLPELVLGRMDCIHVVTDAVAKAVSNLIVVDLQTPQMVVIVEVLPVVGTQKFPICGVAVVSGSLMNTKPKLCVKPLLSVTHPMQRSDS